VEVLIRQRDARNQLATSDRSISAPTIQIGCNPDQDIRLAGTDVRGSHAQLKVSKSGVEISCGRDAPLLLNDQPITKHVLSIGDVLNLAGNKLEVFDAPTGFDLALDITPVAIDAANASGGYKTNLKQSRLSVRKLAWVLTISALFVSMLIPLGYHFLSKSDSPIANKLPFSDFRKLPTVLAKNATLQLLII